MFYKSISYENEIVEYDCALSAGIAGAANEVSEVISNPGSNRGPLDLIPTQETQSQNHQVNFFPERNY